MFWCGDDDRMMIGPPALGSRQRFRHPFTASSFVSCYPRGVELHCQPNGGGSLSSLAVRGIPQYSLARSRSVSLRRAPSRVKILRHSPLTARPGRLFFFVPRPVSRALARATRVSSRRVFLFLSFCESLCAHLNSCVHCTTRRLELGTTARVIWHRSMRIFVHISMALPVRFDFTPLRINGQGSRASGPVYCGK